MSTALHSQTARLTVDDVMEMLRTGALQREDRVELLEGRLVPMSPHSGHHSGVVSSLMRALMTHYGMDAVLVQMPVHLDPFSEPEPDLCVTQVSTSILSRERRHPTPKECLIVVEVSLSSQRRDRKKALIYGTSGVPTYWMVDLADDSITVYSDPGPTGYRSVERHPVADGVLLPDGATRLDLSRLLH